MRSDLIADLRQAAGSSPGPLLNLIREAADALSAAQQAQVPVEPVSWLSLDFDGAYSISSEYGNAAFPVYRGTASPSQPVRPVAGEAPDWRAMSIALYDEKGYLANLAGTQAPEQQAEPAPREFYRHVKTDRVYEVICNAQQESAPNTTMVVYRDVIEGRRWVRRASEFNDGRFVRCNKDGSA